MAAVEVKARVYWRDELGRFAKAVDEGAERAIQQAARDGQYMARIFAPKRTGALAAAISRGGSGTYGYWEAGHAVYMIAQEQGAVPHEIGDRGQVLANEADGFGPVRGPVLHPGNPATHYIKRSYDIIAGQLSARVQKEMP